MRALWSVLMLCLAACVENVPVDAGTGGGGGGNATGGGSATGGGTGGGGSALSLTEFCQQRDSAQCTAGVSCGLFESLAACQALLERQRVEYGILDDCGVGRTAVADGRAAYEASAAASCASSANNCTAVAQSCRSVFRPLVPQGASCFDDRECVQGTYCAKGLSCPGSCQARVPEGQSPQGFADRCLEGLFSALDQPMDGGFGFRFVCRATASAGQPCEYAAGCVEGLTCRGDSMTCGTPRPVGQACVSRDGGFSGTIVVEDCALSSACQPADGGFACGPLGSSGDPCGRCKLDLRCLQGRCASRGVANEACNNINDCAVGHYCRPSGANPLGPGFCQPHEAAGAICRGRTDCLLGLDCAATPPPDGGFFPDYRCGPSDGGGLPCIDRTP